MEGDDDFQRRNIHDDLEQLLEDNSSDDVPFTKATKMENAKQHDEDSKLFDSPSKKRVLFPESGSNQKLSGMMNLDMSKVRMQQDAMDNDQDDNDGDDAQGDGETTTAKKKRKRNRKKNKNKQGNNGNDGKGGNGSEAGQISGRQFDPDVDDDIIRSGDIQQIDDKNMQKKGLKSNNLQVPSGNQGYMSYRGKASNSSQNQKKSRNYDLEYTPLKFKLGESFYEDTDSSEDEGMPDYKIGGYHCMHVGEVLIDRYVIIQKLGWGHFSTVWLAKDINYNTYVALKIQRSASQYLEAAFDEVEILDQCSSYWMKPEWLNSLKSYYSENPEKLKNISGNDCYCVQLLNCFLHHGPHGKHFVTVFEILGVNLLEVIKRYNYKGAPLPIVRQMARQCLIGLDYLHRICKVIHTDLKPENVNLCLTEQEVHDISTKGQLKSTKQQQQDTEDRVKPTAATEKDANDGKASQSLRGRGQRESNDSNKLDKQAKRALKRKLQRQRKKEKLKNMKESAQPKNKGNEGPSQQDTFESVDPGPNDEMSPNMKKGKNKEEDKGKLTLTAMNESASKKKRPFDYNEQESSQNKDGASKAQKLFSLKDLDAEQMREINALLKEYIEVPRAHSLPKRSVIPSPDMRADALNDENLTENQRQSLLQQQIYFQQTGIRIPHRYEYDLRDVHEKKQQMEEFLFYRKKFEKSQRAKAAISGGSQQDKKGLMGQIASLDLTEEMFDPQTMQQQIQEERAKKRGPKLDENMRLKICDLGNGCWTYHHFSTEIQTRQYRSPEVIIGAKYNTTADNWSLACMLFEMATGDFLFEPRNSSNKKYSQDDDHLAQMMELLGPMPRSMALGGTKCRKMFDRQGQLKRIKGLNYWPLHKVLHQKYRFKEDEAKAFADFLLPMLEWDPAKRASAQRILKHPWLKMASNYDTRCTQEELQQKLQKESLAKEKMLKEDGGIDFEAEEMKIETSKLVASDTEQNQADDELSTFSDSDLHKQDYLSSDLDEDSDDLNFLRQNQGGDSKKEKGKKSNKEVDEEGRMKTIRKKEQQFIKRDIAEGRTFNNSFTGPYPEDTDHLHIDKGPNPQFDFLRQANN